MSMKPFEFIDLGASKAESLEFGKNRFGAKRGLGIDLDAERVAALNQAGYNAVVGDITRYRVPKKSVRFAKMSHILEHLPDLKGVEAAIKLAAEAATDFLVITGPFFDEDEYLKSEGFKLPWADYPVHTCYLTTGQLRKILANLKLDNYELYLRLPIRDSSHESILPLSAPPSTHYYDRKKQAKKRPVVFEKPIWRDFVCYVQLKPNVKDWAQMTNAYRQQVPYVIKHGQQEAVCPNDFMQKYADLAAADQTKADQLHDLKKRAKTATEELANARQQLAAIRGSKVWRASGYVRKARAAATRSKAAIKNISGK